MLKEKTAAAVAPLNYVEDTAADTASVKICLACAAEFDRACCLCEEGVVYADADVFACHDGGTALAHDYLAHADLLAVRAFDAEILRIRIGQVMRCSARFYMCHSRVAVSFQLVACR